MTAVTADDYIAGIEGFEALDDRVQTDLLALYLLKHGGATSVSAASIADLRTALRLNVHSRLAQHLSEKSQKGRAGSRALYVKLREGYALERGYARELEQKYLGRPASRNIATSLRGTLAAISDPAVKSYLDEAIAAFEHDHRRAALILTWCVAYGLLRDWLFRNHLAALNAEMANWKKPVKIAQLDDFQELAESVVLETARKATILTKEQHKTLKQLLDERNSYAHPTSKPISPSMVEAYIERVLREVLPAYG